MTTQGVKNRENQYQKALATFKKHGGVLRTAEALRAGIHPVTLYAMRDARKIERLSRGVYRLINSPPLENPDLVIVAKRVPKGIICLISALAFHDLTTQIPHEIYLALPRGAEEPRLDFPPVRTFRFSGRSYSEGVETHRMDGATVRVYSPEKTLADCFKFRNKIGMDTVIEALRLYRERRRIKINELLHYAAICRVTNIMRPYLEAILP